MTLSRNFEFRASPVGAQRGARFVLGGTTDLPIGSPVVVDKSIAPDAMGRLTVKLATQASDAPTSGMGGILVYEYAPVAYRGKDPVLTTFSDLDTVPVGSSVQVVSGDSVIVAFTNTADSTFINRAHYPKARIMVAGLGATPTVAVGDKLTSGAGADGTGYWEETSTSSKEWLTVTLVDAANGLVEAQFRF